MVARARSFGAVAAGYERFRPGYPPELVERVLAYARRPVLTALEIDAGTGKATRAFANRGIALTATEPDAEMLRELRKHVPQEVITVQAALEDLHRIEVYGLVFAAAALHWTAPLDRWSRIAALLEPEGVFASFAGQMHLTDPALDDVVRAARAPYLEDDSILSPDATLAESDMQWPGTELEKSAWFTDVHQSVLGRSLTLSARDYVGYLSTVSAYLQLGVAQREQAFGRILKVLPDHVEVTADIILRMARGGRATGGNQHPAFRITAGAMTVTFTASQSGRTSATVTQRRSFRAPVVTMASLGIASGFVAEMFTPSHAAAHAGAVLVFDGSEGGLAVSAITAEVTPVDPAANIPVGRTGGPVLLLCGTDDALWPSCKASDVVKKELSGRPVTEVREPGAGHLVDFFVPNLPLTSTTSPDVNGNLLDVGGTVQADALGRLDAWPAVLSFLDRIPS